MAGLAIERLLHHRLPMQSSTTSSSVPSTPSQMPRDLRFHSRSPSPHRQLSNQSPRSVVSEAVGHRSSLNGLGIDGVRGVCRFESGAEWRKRRIPYVDGGNEELGPPKKSPKKTLQPDEREKLTGDMRELYDRLLPSEESEQRRTQLVQKLDRILREEYPGSDIAVNVFGSSGNLLSSSDSDVDICITTSRDKLLDMHVLAELLHRHGMENVVCRASARVPIVKCWDPELQLATDLNVNNRLALDNTRMIKTYVQLDDRVRPLAKIIKYWTKRRVLNDAAFGGTISSYTWICMVINFLQCRDPPVLPSLQKMIAQRKKRGKAESGQARMDTGAEDASRFADDVDNLKGFGLANKESQADLLFHFFRHYAYEFDYAKDVVSIREGRIVPRKEKGWDPSNYADKEARNRLCVEEPFTVNRNLGNSADDYAWSGIHAEIRRAFDLLADGCQLEKCCEQFEFPPEELKPIFQRPPPKPKPTLTRSASQSGRPGQDGGSIRQRKPNNRNQSSQRPGNRRASSGATFSNQRIPMGFHTPQVGASVMDYFATKGTLHEQLAQQYQLLQAQQEVLQRRLSQQQLATRVQALAGDLAGSPRHGRTYAEGLASPHFPPDAGIPAQPPLSAPLLPGYFYNYPARYPPSSSQQMRSREGSNTSPSSPSLVSAAPALRRQVHRSSIPEAPNASNRSQSQPGRSFPHPLTMPPLPLVGYDLSTVYPGHYPPPRTAQQYSQSATLPQVPFTAVPSMPHPNHAIDTPIPKEYVGYYVGQSPQLGPQYASAASASIPHVSLRDAPPAQRQRRVTPELMAPFLTGRRTSRSPSPYRHLRSSSTFGDLRSAYNHAPLFHHSTPFDSHQPNVLQGSPPEMARNPIVDTGGPLIVNGSNPGSSLKQPEVVNGSAGSAHSSGDEHSVGSVDLPPRIPPLPIRKRSENVAPHERVEAPETPSRVSPSPRQKFGPRLNLSSPNGASHSADGVCETFHETTPVQAPLLSPVAEMRTPSPTHPGAFDKDSPKTNGLIKAAKLGNARQAGIDTPIVWATHERKGSAPNPSTHVPTLGPSGSATQNANGSVEKNPWQQATGKKGHKKSKSSLSGKPGVQGSIGAVFGQLLPAHDGERKGG